MDMSKLAAIVAAFKLGSHDDAVKLLPPAQFQTFAMLKFTSEFNWLYPHERESRNVTLLQLAAYHGWLDYVEALQNGFSTYNCRDSVGCVPLHYAAGGNRMSVIVYLINELDCDPATQDGYSAFPLHIASLNGHLSIVKYFIASCECDPTSRGQYGFTPLHYASEGGHLDIIQYLITELGCDPTTQDNYGSRPLHVACLNGHFNAMQYFIIERKCDPNCQNGNGSTPLHFASQGGHLNIIRFLINELGCNSKTRNNHGTLPLHMACLNGHLNVTQYFITERKCEPSIRNKKGSTPLHFASQGGHMKIIQYLFTELGCDRTTVNNFGNLPLHIACLNGNLNVAQYFITEQNFDPSIRGEHGGTPLHFASEGGHMNIIKYLITELGCDPMTRDYSGSLPLHLGCLHGHLNVAQYFITEKHFDPNIRGELGFTPLHYASQGGHISIIQSLIIELGCDSTALNSCGNLPLHIACLYGNLKIAQYFIIEQNFDPSIRGELGGTPLHFASEGGQMKVIQYLITELGCDPTTRDNNGSLPLHLACLNGHFNIAQYFIIEHNFDPSIRGEHGGTPLHFASEGGHMNIIKYLITELGCDPMAQDYNGSLPLHLGCLNGHLNTTQFFITEQNFDPNIRGEHGGTPLHFASKGGHMKVIQYLVTDLGCDPTTRDNNGSLPLHLACLNGHLNTAQYFITEQNFVLNVRGELGFTPLHYASEGGHMNIIQYLVTELGCDPNVIDNNGRTILHLAATRGHVHIVKWLLRDKRINLMARDKWNSTFLDLAKEDWNFHFLDPLIESFNNYPIHTFVKTILTGNSGAGKTILANAFNGQGNTDINHLVLGIHKHSFDTGIDIDTSFLDTYEVGNMVLYDLTGQAENHSCHSVVVETVMQRLPATFINAIDLSNTDDEILQQLRYWLNFINNATSKTKIKSCLLIVGSYDHELSHEQIQSKSTLIRNEMRKRSDHQDYMGYVTIDYQDIESEANKEFVSLLNESNECIVARLPPVSCYCHLLYAFLMERAFFMRVCTLKDLMVSIPQNIPKETAFIAELLTTLSKRGVIIFLKNQPQLEKSWIVVDIESLLKRVNKEVLFLKEFKDHRHLGSNTGIIRSYMLKQLFPQFNIEMLVGLLQTLGLCHCVNLSGTSIILQNIDAFSLKEDTELFFPSLLDNFRPITNNYINENFCFGWCLYCNRTGDQYFTSEFLHVLLLRLAYSFPMASSDSTNHSQTKCTVWTNGIYWDNLEEINTAVEVIDHNRCVMVVMSHNNSRQVEFCKHRSAVIRLVLDLKQQLCPDVQTAEYLTSRLYLTSSESVSVPLKSDLLPIENVAISMLQRKRFIFASSGILSDFRTKDALKFEPYYQLSPSSVCELMDGSKADELVSQSLLDEVERICQIKQLKQPSHAHLRKIVDEMSIYAGKNPIVSKLKMIIHYYFYLSIAGNWKC